MFLKVMKILRIGNIFGATGGSFAGNVYDAHGLAPTINTSGGGYREPLILEYECRRNHRKTETGVEYSGPAQS